MFADVPLAFVNFITSALTAITGVGGGMILVGVMPFFVPAVAIVPIHGVTQFVSNATRAWFGKDSIDYTHVGLYAMGAVLGFLVFGIAIRFVKLSLIPLFIGIYILLITWSKTFNALIKRFEKFWLVGFVQTGLGVFVGPPGPLNIAVLNKHYNDNHVVVSTSALMMSFVHFGKIIVYLSIGFAFVDYWQLLIMMTVMATIGSYVGTKLRHKINILWLKKSLPYVLTLLAIKLIIDIVKQWL